MAQQYAEGHFDCLARLARIGRPLQAPDNATVPWCNATFDTLMCWPSIPAGSYAEHRCPPLKGLDPTSNCQYGYKCIEKVRKLCNENGLWAGNPKTPFADVKPWGWTDYYECMYLSIDAAIRAKDVAQIARYFEFIGLGLSLLTLVASISIFLSFRRLRVFRNLVHVQLMFSTLIMTIIRLVIYIDVALTGRVEYTINSSKYICEIVYFLLEYAKTVACMWMIAEGFYLHNTLVISVFGSEPKLLPYCAICWGIPLPHVLLWVTVVIIRSGGVAYVRTCFGDYYFDPEIWVLDAVRLLELLINCLFLLNILRVLVQKVRHSAGGEHEQIKASLKAAFMLIPLLGIPNILQVIPVFPRTDNMKGWTAYISLGTIFYMFQGFFISLLYCFTNKEVHETLSTQWERFKTRHASLDKLRRGSRNPSRHFSMNTATGGNNTLVCATDEDLIKKPAQNGPKCSLPSGNIDPSKTSNNCNNDDTVPMMPSSKNGKNSPKNGNQNVTLTMPAEAEPLMKIAVV